MSDPSVAAARIAVSEGCTEPTATSNLDIELNRSTLDGIAKEWVERTLVPCQKALHDAGLRPADIHEILLVGGQTRMPAIRRAVHELFGQVPDTSVNPEESVARGAAVMAAMLAGVTTGLKLADVVPLSLGVRTRGGTMDVVIPRNT